MSTSKVSVVKSRRGVSLKCPWCRDTRTYRPIPSYNWKVGSCSPVPGWLSTTSMHCSPPSPLLFCHGDSDVQTQNYRSLLFPECHRGGKKLQGHCAVEHLAGEIRGEAEKGGGIRGWPWQGQHGKGQSHEWDQPEVRVSFFLVFFWGGEGLGEGDLCYFAFYIIPIQWNLFIWGSLFAFLWIIWILQAGTWEHSTEYCD